ncbi:MAG TPA: lipoyl(octanoyl) transferase LipB [Chloroflexota bacterium]
MRSPTGATLRNDYTAAHVSPSGLWRHQGVLTVIGESVLGRPERACLGSAVRLIASLDSAVAYEAAWRWQSATAAAVADGGPETLALLQHLPVFSFGRRIRREHLLVDPIELAGGGAAIVESDRGGDVTFHGPGQLVAYPILDLRSRGLGPVDYVCRLEELVIRTLARFGISGERWPGRPGVWVDGSKIAAIGVRIRRGVSTHGLALNVETNLSWFDAIVPCGISDAGVTSMTKILGASPGLPAVADELCDAFADVFDCKLVGVPVARQGGGSHKEGRGQAPALPGGRRVPAPAAVPSP